jgi:membrane-bound serine protease (ClpP class)
VVSGAEEMATATGIALEDFAEVGRVRVHGEVWRAQTDRPVRRGQSIRVVARSGLVLTVRPLDQEE